MKRITFIVAVFFLFAGSSATRVTNANVTRALLAAAHNERTAAARYEAFAARAADEGYAGAAALFRAEARAEQVHASRFENFLQSRGIDFEEAGAPKAAVFSTSDNFRAAINNEQQERDSIYLQAYRDAMAAGDAEAAKLFDTIRDAETEHLNLDNAASRNLSSMKQPKAYYVCPACGYTTDIALPFCPSCRGQSMEKFD